MNERIAVIDLGTNTFHLLIVEKQDNKTFTEIYRERIFVKLAEDGIKTIGEAPFQRGLDALSKFQAILKNHNIQSITAFGTAALRTADNGQEFIQTVYESTGIQIQLIPGDKEAELIYKGVIQAVDIQESDALIIDIGGGSVEFIIANDTKIKWAQSFPIGVSVLYNNFHETDPISTKEIETLKHFLEQELSPLFTQLKIYSPTTLIGASGTFDVLENILCKKKISPNHAIVEVKDFYPFYSTLLNTNLEERYKMENIPPSRAEMIIVALILIHFILEKAPIKSISVSSFAMKEGMLKELIDQL